jgi:hypothetical protein
MFVIYCQSAKVLLNRDNRKGKKVSGLKHIQQEMHAFNYIALESPSVV